MRCSKIGLKTGINEIMADMLLSVCIVNHNAKTLTLNCLRSIAEQTKIAHEVILVDNASSDNVVSEVEKSFPRTLIIANKINNGFALANNQAMKIARGKYIILLNNDTLLLNDALGIMVKFFEQDPTIGALTCKLFEADGETIQRNCRSFPTVLGTMFGRSSLLTRLFPGNPFSAKNILSDWKYNSKCEIDWVSGAAIMVRREVVDRVGMLDDKTLYMYWEDTDWCKRIRGAGWQIWFVPEGRIVHYSGQGGGKRSLLLKLYTMLQMHRSAYYYFRKHYYHIFFHPMAILTLIGMMSMISVKTLIEIWGAAFRLLRRS